MVIQRGQIVARTEFFPLFLCTMHNFTSHKKNRGWIATAVTSSRTWGGSAPAMAGSSRMRAPLMETRKMSLALLAFDHFIWWSLLARLHQRACYIMRQHFKSSTVRCNSCSASCMNWFSQKKKKLHEVVGGERGRRQRESEREDEKTNWSV